MERIEKENTHTDDRHSAANAESLRHATLGIAMPVMGIAVMYSFVNAVLLVGAEAVMGRGIVEFSKHKRAFTDIEKMVTSKPPTMKELDVIAEEEKQRMLSEDE